MRLKPFEMRKSGLKDMLWIINFFLSFYNKTKQWSYRRKTRHAQLDTKSRPKKKKKKKKKRIYMCRSDMSGKLIQ